MKFYASILRPLLFCLDAELAHQLAIQALKLGFSSRAASVSDPILKSNLWGIDFPTPIGMAAGFDKNAEVIEPLLKLGFGFVETGSVTPLAQPGNEKPRVFRLPDDQGIINRLGFNNRGLDAFQQNFQKWKDNGRLGVVGANIGKNKLSEDKIADFVTGVAAMAEYASYLVVNVSSPNTPGLRDLQARNDLRELLEAVMAARGQNKIRPPLLLKIAPDLTDDDKSDIAEVAVTTKIDGIIVSNTTIDRPDSLVSSKRMESGGLSGAPLFEKSTRVLSEMYQLTDGKMPLVGVGGISTGEQAYAKIKAGASLVQLYSAMIYRGPHVAVSTANELASLLRRDGYSSVAEAIGADHL